MALTEAAGAFSHIAGRPRSWRGELARLALSNPPLILKLAAAERDSSRRVNCRACELCCEEGAACPKLAAADPVAQAGSL
jgi:hypothetical protein